MSKNTFLTAHDLSTFSQFYVHDFSNKNMQPSQQLFVVLCIIFFCFARFFLRESNPTVLFPPYGRGDYFEDLAKVLGESTRDEQINEIAIADLQSRKITDNSCLAQGKLFEMRTN